MCSKDGAGVPEWSRQIETFRRSLKLTQLELAKRLGTSAMSVSRWERGILEVPADVCIKLGNLAGDPLCWYFWGRAGLRSEDVMRVLPAARDRLHESRIASVLVVHAGGKKGPAPIGADLVAIPFLPVDAATPGERGDKDVDLEQLRPETMLAAPQDWCPNPDSTICIRVKGNSMSPLILDGYIIAVDTSDVRREALVGQIVVASNVERGCWFRDLSDSIPPTPWFLTIESMNPFRWPRNPSGAFLARFCGG
jgi:DNA-binding XRE family transcriptional regulator